MSNAVGRAADFATHVPAERESSLPETPIDKLFMSALTITK